MRRQLQCTKLNRERWFGVLQYASLGIFNFLLVVFLVEASRIGGGLSLGNTIISCKSKLALN